MSELIYEVVDFPIPMATKNLIFYVSDSSLGHYLVFKIKVTPYIISTYYVGTRQYVLG